MDTYWHLWTLLCWHPWTLTCRHLRTPMGPNGPLWHLWTSIDSCEYLCTHMQTLWTLISDTIINFYTLGYFRLWCYGPSLAKLKSKPICYNDLIAILVTLIIKFAIKLINELRVFKRSRRLLLDSTGDSATERLQISLKIYFIIFSKKFHKVIWYSE